MSTAMSSIKKRGKMYEKMCRSIVCIHHPGADDPVIGGGIFIEVNSKPLVLTSAHIVGKKKTVCVVTCYKNTYVAQRVHRDVKRDVALLKVQHEPNEIFQCARLSETSELIRAAEIHFIGHPGRQTFAYNIGNVSCVEKTCGDVIAELQKDVDKMETTYFVDDFRRLSRSLTLIQSKNVHGGGRFGGTGAPFLDINGNIIGLYSFTLLEEDHAVHVGEIRASIESFEQGQGRQGKNLE